MIALTRLAAIIQAVFGFMLVFPIAAFAQSTGTSGTTGGTSIGAGNAGCTAVTGATALQNGNGQLAGIVVFLTGTPFKVAAAIYFVVAIIMLFLDNGHLPQMVKHLLTVFLGIAAVGLIVGFLFGSNANIAQC